MILWRCWLGGRKGIRPVKNWVVGAGVVICLEQSADLHMAQLMPLPLTVSCFSKIQIGFTFLVPAHPGSPWQRAVKCVCVCVCLWVGPLSNVLCGGLNPQGKGNLGGISQPIVKYGDYLAWAKVVWKVAAVMQPFAVSTAAACSN